MNMENKPIPFFMAYPLPLFLDEETNAMRQAEYLKSMYPMAARQIEIIVSHALEILDYDESMIYDEYPDKIMIRRLMGMIYDQVATLPGMQNKKDLVDVLVIEDLLKRRDRRKEKKLDCSCGFMAKTLK